MKKLLVLMNLAWPVIMMAQVQDTLTLNLCHKDAISNYPMIKQRELLDKITEERIKSLQVNYLPQVNLNGSAAYQSDVTEIPIHLPNIKIPGMDKDSYKISLDVNQVIYDGGQIHSQKKLENVSLQADKQNLEAELYKVKERVNQIYFSLLLVQESRKILESVNDNLVQKQSTIESAVKNGVVLESQLDVIKAEILNVEQQMVELDVSRQAGLEMLGEFINKVLPVNQLLQVPPVIDFATGLDNKRLEPLVMELQQQRLDVSKSLAGSKYKPRIYAFAQAGYGKPGLNMLKNEFDSWWMMGAKVNWTLWNWNQLKKEQKVFDLQKEIIGTQRQTFDKNLAISLENQAAQVNKYKALLDKDDEIISLRVKVTKASASQLQNGIITSSDYVNELNNETQARLNRESHRLQLVKAKVDYLTMKGRY